MNVIQFPQDRVRPRQRDVLDPHQRQVDRVVDATGKALSTGAGQPHPAGMPEDWPDGQLGIELDRMARLIQDRGQKIGKPCTLDRARRSVLAALQDADAATRPPTEREVREARIAQLLADRAQRAGIDLKQVVTNTGRHGGSDPTLQRIMAATQREAKARIARSKQ